MTNFIVTYKNKDNLNTLAELFEEKEGVNNWLTEKQPDRNILFETIRVFQIRREKRVDLNIQVSIKPLRNKIPQVTEEKAKDEMPKVDFKG